MTVGTTDGNGGCWTQLSHFYDFVIKFFFVHNYNSLLPRYEGFEKMMTCIISLKRSAMRSP